MSRYHGIVLCHGSLATGLIDNVDQIMGDTERLHPFTNAEKSIPEMVDELTAFIDAYHIQRIVFFVDLRGGSCWRVAKQLAKDRDAPVISGVNIPMLIQFLSDSDESETAAALTKRLTEKAQAAIIGE